MKKILLLILILLLFLGGFLVYRLYRPVQNDLDVTVQEEDVTSLQDKLSIEIPDLDAINDNEQKVTIKEFEYQEVELNNAEASLLMNLAISSVIPCSDVQALCHEGRVEVSAVVTLPEDLIEKSGLPAALIPEKASVYLDVELVDSRVNVTSATLNRFPVPKELMDTVNQSISNVLKEHGFEEVTVHENKMIVKGNLPSKVE